ncbi:DNA cytosine methyltransferase [Bradyrhizobium betae]|nr:DNA cytosine methyltransferase [Bradyrhizobium betae]
MEIIVDSFAGGGGASTGIEMALGRSPDIAINHDAIALAMHEVNHPSTVHLTEDIWSVDPRAACAGRPVGLLWASPDCKHFSKAKGGKPVEKSIRSLAWIVVHWANTVAPRVIILENVEEFATWGPLGTDGRPCPLQKGVTFKRWVAELERLGYVVEWRELRACDYGAPTIMSRVSSRDAISIPRLRRQPRTCAPRARVHPAGSPSLRPVRISGGTMNTPLIKPTRVLRTLEGEPPLGIGGLAFRDDQGEWLEHDNPRYRSPSTRIGALALQGGGWLAHPPGFRVDGRQYASREAALRAAIAAMIRRARKYMRAKDGEGTHWTEGFAARVIEWALSLKPVQVPETRDVSANLDQQINSATGELAADELPGSAGLDGSGDIPSAASSPVAPVEMVQNLDQQTYAAIDAGETISDPIVRDLIEAFEKRKQFPAHHTFSMTTEVADGRVVSVATCKCGHVIKFGSNDYVRMNAATEAHWRRFPEGPTVDGRGDPIVPGDASRIAGSKPKRRKKSSDGRADEAMAREADPVVGAATLDARLHSNHGGADQAGMGSERPSPSEANVNIADRAPIPTPVLRSEPASLPPSQDAGSTLAEAAPIGAGGNVIARRNDVIADGWSDLLTAAAGLAWDDEAALPVLHSYDQFLHDKVVTAPMRGIEVPLEALHDYLRPHCKDLVVWALRLGCAAIFASFGLHKTAMQLEWCRQLQRRNGGATLSVLPLGVRHGFVKEAVSLDMAVRFIRTNEEYHLGRAEGVVHFLTNYESIRDGKLDPNLFTACSLDEASVLRSYGSKTFQEFLPLFGKVAFKLVATATPSPNRYKELIHYSGFLGVMDTGLALTRFFQRNSEKAGDLTLYPHKEEEFWMWVHSWAAFLQKPSELGYSDEGYELPPLTLRWHEVPADHSKAEPERDGQSVLFRKGASSLQDAARARRDSLPSRIAKMQDLLAQDPDSHRILWHDLEAEREAIEAAVPGVVAITGSGMDIDEREKHLHDFEEGRTKYFATKPILSGSGSNFQYHCHKAIYVGLPGDGYKFNDWIQSVYRLQRFGQKHPVEIDIIYSEDMRAGRAALEEKWALDTAMRARMSEIIAAHGLNTLPLRDKLLRTMTIKRIEEKGENFTAINNDAVLECRAWPEASVDLIVTSIPFSNHYEYSASYRDFGHTDDNGHFWAQMDFLSCELMRMLQPGRLACIHVKDRVLFGSVTGEGVPTISPFHAEAISHYRGHKFQYLGMITVVTDVVRENNQTYRLGWSENAKDSSKMGVGSPEYVLLFRKPQTDRTRSYADVPVEKSKDDYTRARWQIDAHGFWRSSGDRLLTADEFAAMDAADHAKHFSKLSAERIYDYEAHVAIGERLEAQGALPATFMAIAPGSHDPEVWSDINRMRTLNMMQQRKGAEMHLCPLQFDIVDRLIERYSNEGELVFDPFGGLMTVPFRALLKGRKGAATELSTVYFADGVKYLRQAEEKMAVPALFDLAAVDAANPPPAMRK